MYQISPMKQEDVPCALAIWHRQFEQLCKSDSFPDFFRGGQETVKRYLRQQIERGNAIVALEGSDIAGYMAWMCFDFHSERSAFLPIVGNAAQLENENTIFHTMYTAAADKWVRDNRFNHLWMMYENDVLLRNKLYDLGFGSYVMDACQRTDHYLSMPGPNWTIKKASHAHIDAILFLENASESNLLTSPTFLRRDAWQREDAAKLIADKQVFLAWDANRVVGMLSFDINQTYHFEHLTCAESAGSTCLYVLPEYRRKGIGTALIKAAFEYCHKAQKPFLHVSFETANPDAMHFWSRHFKPVIRSVRRTINKDANSVSLS